MNTASYDWLLPARSDGDFDQINVILNGTSLRFDQNIVLGYSRTPRGRNTEPLTLCDNNFVYKRNENEDVGNSRRNIFHKDICRTIKDNCKSIYEINYYRTSRRFSNLTRNKTYNNGRVSKLFQSGILYYNNSRVFDMTNISRFSLNQQFNSWNRFARLDATAGVHMLQYFKVRANSTLYACYLGKNVLRDTRIEYVVP